MDEQKKYLRVKNSYCISHEERNKNIRSAMARITKRIQPGTKRDDPIAIVAYGPSLNQTWEEIKNFQQIMSMSGSHKFLVERGILPTYHLEVDPRAHKCKMLGTPQKDTRYLIAADCHPTMFDALEGYDVTLWQVLSEEIELQEIWDIGDYALAGGTGVGARAFVMAKFLGFSDFHIFGMDGCLGESGSHAALHTNAPLPKDVFEVEETGRRFLTTSAMLGAVTELGTQMDSLPGTSFTFYGDGLVQWCASRYIPKQWGPGHVPVIAIQKIPANTEFDHPAVETKLLFHPTQGEEAKLELLQDVPVTMSKEYLDLNIKLHETSSYGMGGGKHAPNVVQLTDFLQTKDVLDYGCGKGDLAKLLPFPIHEYDPAIFGKQKRPQPADIVVCADVLEHIEPEYLDKVLIDLQSLVKRMGYFAIHMSEARKSLADGRNAHLTQENEEWWTQRLNQYFIVDKTYIAGTELYVVVRPLGSGERDRFNIVMEST